MTNTLLRPAQWAESEFALAQLGDQRRTQRLVKIATNLVQQPGGTLPQAFPSGASSKPPTGFSINPRLPSNRFSSRTGNAPGRPAKQPGEYLLIEDTTELDYTDHPATEEMGRIGDGRGRGLLLHTTLAVRLEGWDLEERPRGSYWGCWPSSAGTVGGSPGARGRLGAN